VTTNAEPTVAPGMRLGTYVYERLKERLLDGAYPSGTKLSIKALRAEFGVSKQPIAQGLRHLSADGLIDVLPQVGCVVRSYHADDVRAFFVLLAGVERTIAELAAARRTPEQLHRLRDEGDRMMRLHQSVPIRDLPGHYRRGNRRFHGLIHEMADSKLLSSVSRPLWDLTDFMVHAEGSNPEALAQSLAERTEDHEAIISALEQGDPSSASALSHQHLLHTLRLIDPTPFSHRSAETPRASGTSSEQLAAQVYDRLKDRLLNGELKPGTRLPVQELTNEYRMSRQPVMAALGRLATDALVDVVPQVGCSVRNYGGEDVADFFLMMGRVSESVVSLAAEHPSDDQHARMTGALQMVTDLQNPTNAPITVQRRLAHREFHASIHEMARSTLVVAISLRLWDLMDFIIHTKAPQALTSEAVIEQLRVIAAGLRNHDESAARQGARTHAAQISRLVCGLTHQALPPGTPLA
jgi:DNA-binding GntR family transcriptional regulator